MFRVEHNVPEVYINNSRDFQLISRLYDLAFQQVRQSCDSMEYITDTKQCNSALLPLLSTKLGFFDEIQLPDEVYRQVLSVFPVIIRNKGSERALELVVYLFEKIANTSITLKIEKNSAEILFNRYSAQLELLSKLIEYVRPAGFIITWKTVASVEATQIDFIQTDNVTVKSLINEYEASQIHAVSVSGTAEDTSAATIGFAQVTNHENYENPKGESAT